MEELKDALKASYTNAYGKPIILDHEQTADVQAWLQPYTNPVNNVTSSHQYKYVMKCT